MQYLMSIDQGTTGTTVMIFAVEQKNVQVLSRSNQEFEQHYPDEGWVEHDLDQIWESVEVALSESISQASKSDGSFSPEKLAGIGITNQRETLTIFERDTGRPACKAIVWQCKRSQQICKALKAEGKEKSIRAKTGLLLDPYFTGTKLKWVFDHKPEIAERILQGELQYGTIDTFLLHRLTGQQVWATEASNASRTLLYDIEKNEFSKELIQVLGLPENLPVPKIQDSASEFGKTKGLKNLPDGIPITGILGDQQAALFGQRCFNLGQAKCTYGTGAFLLAPAGDSKPDASMGILATVAWQLNGNVQYALEGAAFTCGASVQFIRDQLGFVTSSQETEQLAKNVNAAPNVYFVPALAGLGAPYWNPAARGAFLGMNRSTSKEILVRATLEGMALQVMDLANAMEELTGTKLSSFKVDGGAAANDVLMNFQSNIMDLPIVRPKILETTALGASLIAGIGSKVFENLDHINSLEFEETEFQSKDSSLNTAEIVSGWKRANEAVKVFSGAN